MSYKEVFIKDLKPQQYFPHYSIFLPQCSVTLIIFIILIALDFTKKLSMNGKVLIINQ